MEEEEEEEDGREEGSLAICSKEGESHPNCAPNDYLSAACALCSVHTFLAFVSQILRMIFEN